MSKNRIGHDHFEFYRDQRSQTKRNSKKDDCLVFEYEFTSILFALLFAMVLSLFLSVSAKQKPLALKVCNYEKITNFRGATAKQKRTQYIFEKDIGTGDRIHTRIIDSMG